MARPRRARRAGRPHPGGGPSSGPEDQPRAAQVALGPDQPRSAPIAPPTSAIRSRSAGWAGPGPWPCEGPLLEGLHPAVARAGALAAIVPPAGTSQPSRPGSSRGVLAGNAALCAAIVPQMAQVPGPPVTDLAAGPPDRVLGCVRCLRGPDRRRKRTRDRPTDRGVNVRSACEIRGEEQAIVAPARVGGLTGRPIRSQNQEWTVCIQIVPHTEGHWRQQRRPQACRPHPDPSVRAAAGGQDVRGDRVRRPRRVGEAPVLAQAADHGWRRVLSPGGRSGPLSAGAPQGALRRARETLGPR